MESQKRFRCETRCKLQVADLQRARGSKLKVNIKIMKVGLRDEVMFRLAMLLRFAFFSRHFTCVFDTLLVAIPSSMLDVDRFLRTPENRFEKISLHQTSTSPPTRGLHSFEI